MKKQFTLLILLGSVFLLSAPEVIAARNIFISSSKNSLSPDEEMTVTASVSGFTNGEKIYLKGAFFKEGSSNYFGYTKYNNSWIKNSSTSNLQKEVTIGNWDNSVLVKVDYTDSGFTGVGDYKFKLGFYYVNGNGNLSSVNWSSNSLSVSFNSVPSPTSKPVEASNSNTSDINSQSNVSDPTPTSVGISYTSISSKNAIKSAKITDVKKDASHYAQIKPIERTETEEKNKDVQVLGSKNTNFPPIFLVSGIILLLVAAYIYFKRELKERNIL